MSRGLGKIQRTILAILRGEERPQVYAISPYAESTTAEIREELTARGLISDDVRQKVAMAMVVRACGRLSTRGLLTGTYQSDIENTGRTTIWWKAVKSMANTTHLATESRLDFPTEAA